MLSEFSVFSLINLLTSSASLLSLLVVFLFSTSLFLFVASSSSLLSSILSCRAASVYKLLTKGWLGDKPSFLKGSIILDGLFACCCFRFLLKIQLYRELHNCFVLIFRLPNKESYYLLL